MNCFAKMRIEANLRQEQAAEALNVDRSTVAKWETGKAKPRAEKLLAIAKLYKCPVAALLSDESEAPETPKKAV